VVTPKITYYMTDYTALAPICTTAATAQDLQPIFNGYSIGQMGRYQRRRPLRPARMEKPVFKKPAHKFEGTPSAAPGTAESGHHERSYLDEATKTSCTLLMT